MMKFTDIAAASMMNHDGNAEYFIKKDLDKLYSYPFSYSFTMSYGDSSVTIGDDCTDWDRSVVRTYGVEFGGVLEVRLSVRG